MTNPYTPGTTEIIHSISEGTREKIQDKDTFKKLYKASDYLKALIFYFLFLTGVGLMFTIIPIFTRISNGEGIIFGTIDFFFLLVSLIVFSTMWAAWKRPAWGQGLILLVSFFNLFNFPVGTIFGAVGLYAG